MFHEQGANTLGKKKNGTTEILHKKSKLLAKRQVEILELKRKKWRFKISLDGLNKELDMAK
jgi:hypothetical protein